MCKLAAIAVASSGIMYMVALVLGKFEADVLPMIIPAVLYLVFGYYLLKHKRWAAWLTFIFMLIGMTTALLNVNNNGFAPNWVFYSISALNVITAVCLLIVLWRSKVDETVVGNEQMNLTN